MHGLFNSYGTYYEKWSIPHVCHLQVRQTYIFHTLHHIKHYTLNVYEFLHVWFILEKWPVSYIRFITIYVFPGMYVFVSFPKVPIHSRHANEATVRSRQL